MNNNYYLVETRCGHVGKGYYISKIIPVRAENGKEAAFKARSTPRVKHDDKYAIINVTKISFLEYLLAVEEHNKDSYFSCHNKQEQNEAIGDVSKIRVKINKYAIMYKKNKELDTPKKKQMFRKYQEEKLRLALSYC